MVKYCSESGCGGKTEYTVTPPKFCSKCGEPFDKAFKKKVEASKTAPVVTQVIIQKNVAPVEEEVNLPQPSINDVIVATASKVTIGDLSRVATPLKESSPITSLPADIEVTSKTPFKIQDLE